ncbi:ADP-glyceromanno-heptose 6-epimerase [Zavarzinia sp. CC-PAN008]|uniref:ADP-glyceromanno-heptose 6-epimerase n=1 Tax=Zavarzinia sp. CC-PAN008 TaxID=3243332 RepID=UPI003F7479B8
MILVTGGAGFIGSNIVAALSDLGRPPAVCDVLGTDDKWRNLGRHELADLVDPAGLADWLARNGHELEAIVHMGAISSTMERDADLIADSNFRLSKMLWSWCATNGVPLVYASSAATYGDGAAGFDDAFSVEALARLRPLNAYGWSKHLFDRFVARAVADRRPQPPQWAGLKFFNVYGPNEYHKGDMRSVLGKTFESVRGGEPLRLFRSRHPDYGDGGQMRDFVWVGDVVDAVLWLLANPSVSGLFNLGSGRARSWLDLGHALFAALGQPPRIDFVDMPDALAGKYQYFTEAPMARLRAAGFGGNTTSLEDGVALYVQRYLATDDPYR